jgi:hypothetical protein
MFRATEKPTKSNRRPKFLETHATPTKQTGSGLMIQPGEIMTPSNRKETTFFAFDFGPCVKAFRPSISAASFRHRKQKANPPPPIFVAIKTRRDRLFCYSYTPFLISPCSDYSSLRQSRSGVPAGSGDDKRSPTPRTRTASKTTPHHLPPSRIELWPPPPYSIEAR